MINQDVNIVNLASICSNVKPTDDHAVLLESIAKLIPHLAFKWVLTRGGWYRQGGVVDRQGQRICHNLSAWISSLKNDDVNILVSLFAKRDPIVTRLRGKTHYMVARTGERPEEYVQLEIEEIEEVVERPLFDQLELPETVDELADPLEYSVLEPQRITAPRYVFRRIIPIENYLTRAIEEMDTGIPILRFMSDWQDSSAGEHPFSDHWVLGFREYTDGYGQMRFQAKPISTYTGGIAKIQNEVPRGSELAKLIHDFDRRVGYPMAWYFYMLSHREVAHQVAESIHRDLMGAYDYLPPRDVKLLQKWYDKSYAV